MCNVISAVFVTRCSTLYNPQLHNPGSPSLTLSPLALSQLQLEKSIHSIQITSTHCQSPLQPRSTCTGVFSDLYLCLSTKSTTANNKIDNGWIYYLAVSISGSSLCIPICISKVLYVVLWDFFHSLTMLQLLLIKSLQSWILYCAFCLTGTLSWLYWITWIEQIDGQLLFLCWQAR